MLFTQLRCEPPHLLLERLAVVLLRLGADVAAGREYMAVLADVLQRRALAEAGDVGVVACVLFAAPGVLGTGDASDLFVGEFAVGAVDHANELAGVDEQYLAAAVAETSTPTPALLQRGGGRLSGLVACQEPQAGWDLRRVE